jgi:hypothetical protein
MRKTIITLTIIALIASVIGTGVVVIFESSQSTPTEQSPR